MWKKRLVEYHCLGCREVKTSKTAFFLVLDPRCNPTCINPPISAEVQTIRERCCVCVRVDEIDQLGTKKERLEESEKLLKLQEEQGNDTEFPSEKLRPAKSHPGGAVTMF